MKTTLEIFEAMRQTMAERAGFLPDEGCELAVRLYAAAAQIESLYAYADWSRRQCFPQTAAGEYLDASLRVSGTFMDSGDAFLKVGRFSDAINAFSRAGSAAAEKLAEAHYLYAESCAARGEWSEAEKQYLAAGEYENAGERLHEMYLAAGKALAAQGNLKESIAMYMKSGLDSEETVP